MYIDEYFMRSASDFVPREGRALQQARTSEKRRKERRGGEALPAAATAAMFLVGQRRIG